MLVLALAVGLGLGATTVGTVNEKQAQVQFIAQFVFLPLDEYPFTIVRTAISTGTEGLRFVLYDGSKLWSQTIDNQGAVDCWCECELQEQASAPTRESQPRGAGWCEALPGASQGLLGLHTELSHPLMESPGRMRSLAA